MMKTPPDAADQKNITREIMAWVSLLGCVVLFLFFGSIFLFRDLPQMMSIDTTRTVEGLSEAAFIGLFAILSVGVLTYAGCIVWLIFAKLVFTRDEVLKVMTARRASRFDYWLLNKVFPKI